MAEMQPFGRSEPGLNNVTARPAWTNAVGRRQLRSAFVTVKDEGTLQKSE